MTQTSPDKLVIRGIEALKKSGAKIECENGKMRFLTRPITNHMWRYVKHDPRMNCTLWKTVIYQAIGNSEWIPSMCQNCYKVVVRPKTYNEFLELEKFMVELDHPSKLGCETRHAVGALYGAYFYNRGLDEGKVCWKKVASEWPIAILKRGCTEFEYKHGPSDKWEVTDFQKEIEREVENSIEVPPQTYMQSENEINKLHDKWKNFAWKFDLSYEGPNLYPRYVTYH